jgi:hypothetical protein
MNLKTLVRATVMAGVALMLAACVRVTERDAARVDCGTPGPHGVDCTIKRTAGSGGFEVCWDLVITCRNKGEMSGGACHKVAPGKNEASETMPVTSFSNQSSCDVPTAGKVERMKVTTLRSL